MNFKILLVLILVFAWAQAFAAEGKITINSPANGAMVSAKGKVPVNYESVLSSSGDHLHLYVDGERIDVLRQIKGSTELDSLAPGKHKICLTENTKSHAATGLETCIDVTAQ
jgi:hypothetical protein